MQNSPAMQETQETQFLSLGREDPLEEEMATQPSILAGIIPWTERIFGGLYSPWSLKELTRSLVGYIPWGLKELDTAE